MLCDKAGRPEPETLIHAMLECPENQQIPAQLLTELQTSLPGLTGNQVLTLDLHIDRENELPTFLLLQQTAVQSSILIVSRTVDRILQTSSVVKNSAATIQTDMAVSDSDA
jgi:hypothetical protein